MQNRPQVIVVGQEDVQRSLEKPSTWRTTETPSFLEQLKVAYHRASQADITQIVSSPIVAKHRRIMSIATRHNLPIKYLGPILTFDEPRLYQNRWGTDWALMRLKQDPLYQHMGGRFLLPQQVFRQLQRYVRAGLDVHDLWVAHEFPHGLVQPGQPIPYEYLVPPAPPNKVKRLRILNQMSERYWQGVQAAVLTAGIGTAVVGVAAVGVPILAAGAAIALGATATGLDPILFGLVIDDSKNINGQHPALCYALAQWAWPEA
jgi:hypothetical protein